MEAVNGELMDELAKTLNKEDQETLNSNVVLYINNTVLPQLKKLRFQHTWIIARQYCPSI